MEKGSQPSSIFHRFREAQKLRCKHMTISIAIKTDWRRAKVSRRMHDCRSHEELQVLTKKFEMFFKTWNKIDMTCALTTQQLKILSIDVRYSRSHEMKATQ